MSHPFQTASDVRKHDASRDRPAEPALASKAWYRGWEVSFNDEAEKWTRTGWQAYKGGCDLDAPMVDGKTFTECLDAIDESEDA